MDFYTLPSMLKLLKRWEILSNILNYKETMQNQHIKLHEIIWEITGACKNGCTYCGSKENWKEEIDERKIRLIAEAIGRSKYKPREINITGGDPLLVSFETHAFIVEEFESVEISPKILCNLKSLDNINDYRNNAFDILKLYDWVGISINTEEDLQLLNDWQYQLSGINYTIITNFNLENVFIFERIKEYCKKTNKMWQIQYTVYKNEDEPLALYNNKSANEFFHSAIQRALSGGVQLAIADNLNNGKCGAGISTLGILSDGTVVPCLSMRSWNNDIYGVSQGNILKEGLTSIWVNMFLDYRFGEFKCCKDKCKNKCFTPPVKEEYIWEQLDKLIPKVFPNETVKPYIPDPSPNITVYGVITPNYPPYYPKETHPISICMYAVSVPSTSTGIYTPDSVTTTDAIPDQITWTNLEGSDDSER